METTMEIASGLRAQEKKLESMKVLGGEMEAASGIHSSIPHYEPARRLQEPFPAKFEKYLTWRYYIYIYGFGFCST